MTKKNKLIAIISSVTAVVLILGITCMILFIPRTGEIKYDPWTIYDEFVLEDHVFEITMQDDDFNILQLSDIQITFKSEIKEAKEQIEEMVAAEEPDLIVLAGDNSQGPFNDAMYKKVIEVMESVKTPWTIVFGNHDTEGRADKNYLVDVLLEADTEYLIFSAGPSNITGAGNFVINVLNSAGTEVVYSLQMIDSNEYIYREDGNEYAYIDYDQQAYFQWVYDNMSEYYGQTDIKSMAFYHIAPIELKYFVDELLESGATYPLTSEDSDQILFGEFNEGACSSLINSGAFAAGEGTNTTHTFIGHDHINNASVYLELENGYSQIVTYGTKTGTGSYYFDYMQGGTIITISATSEVTINHFE